MRGSAEESPGGQTERKKTTSHCRAPAFPTGDRKSGTAKIVVKNEIA